MASIKIEIRRGNESWFLVCYAGSLLQAMTDYNRRRAQGYKVRMTNRETGFIIQEDK